MEKKIFDDIKYNSENTINDIKENFPSAVEVYLNEEKQPDYWKDVKSLFNDYKDKIEREGQQIGRGEEAGILFVSLLKKKMFVDSRKGSLTLSTSITFAWRTALDLFFKRVIEEDDGIIPSDYVKFLEDNRYLEFSEKLYEGKILQKASQCFKSFHNKNPKHSLASNNDYKLALGFTPLFSQFENDLLNFYKTTTP